MGEDSGSKQMMNGKYYGVLCAGVDAQGNACKKRVAVNPVIESIRPTLPDDAIRCDFCKTEAVYQQDRLDFFDEYDAKFWNFPESQAA